MDGDKDEKIRTRAYHIWEQNGRPEGRHHEHWQQAEQEANDYPGMMGDGTEEQNLDQPGHPDARITEDEVQEAFGSKSGS